MVIAARSEATSSLGVEDSNQAFLGGPICKVRLGGAQTPVMRI